MDDATVAIVVAIITAGVTVLGWTVSHYFARRREDRTRRIESTIDRLERQIEEFYGPLVSLIEQIFNVWRVRKNILGGVSADRHGAIDGFVWKEYFRPIHDQIRDLLEKKLYLVDRQDVRDSVRDYLEHSTQELFQHRLGEELGISTDHVEGRSWPQKLYPRVSAALEAIREKRERLLADLES